jgi:hypothetical protein
MDKVKITIVTGTGGIFGTGHMQRMLNLAVHLNRTENFNASIFLKHREYPLEEKFNSLLTNTIPSGTGLIIRDMRDSSSEEMQLLKQTAPVLAIDDSGEGCEYADYAINLLPTASGNLKSIRLEKSLFLYGYNFAEGIALLNEKNSFLRDIDIALYAGYEPSPELLSSIKTSIPDTFNSVLLAGGKALNFTGEILKPEIPYAEIISRSKIVITHFGLTMFEADACGCKIAALNPSAYHSSLTELVRKDFDIIYSSEYKNFAPDDLKRSVESESVYNTEKDFSPSDIINKINTSTENFIKYLGGITNKKSQDSVI